jgi:hypothetical protein
MYFSWEVTVEMSERVVVVMNRFNERQLLLRKTHDRDFDLTIGQSIKKKEEEIILAA